MLAPSRRPLCKENLETMDDVCNKLNSILFKTQTAKAQDRVKVCFENCCAVREDFRQEVQMFDAEYRYYATNQAMEDHTIERNAKTPNVTKAATTATMNPKVCDMLNEYIEEVDDPPKLKKSKRHHDGRMHKRDSHMHKGDSDIGHDRVGLRKGERSKRKYQ